MVILLERKLTLADDPISARKADYVALRLGTIKQFVGFVDSRRRRDLVGRQTGVFSDSMEQPVVVAGFFRRRRHRLRNLQVASRR